MNKILKPEVILWKSDAVVQVILQKTLSEPVMRVAKVVR